MAWMHIIIKINRKWFYSAKVSVFHIISKVWENRHFHIVLKEYNFPWDLWLKLNIKYRFYDFERTPSTFTYRQVFTRYTIVPIENLAMELNCFVSFSPFSSPSTGDLYAQFNGWLRASTSVFVRNWQSVSGVSYMEPLRRNNNMNPTVFPRAPRD